MPLPQRVFGRSARLLGLCLFAMGIGQPECQAAPRKLHDDPLEYAFALRRSDGQCDRITRFVHIPLRFDFQREVSNWIAAAKASGFDFDPHGEPKKSKGGVPCMLYRGRYVKADATPAWRFRAIAYQAVGAVHMVLVGVQGDDPAEDEAAEHDAAVLRGSLFVEVARPYMVPKQKGNK